MKFDSTPQAIDVLKRQLALESDTYLAGFLGVTEKSLNEWKKRGVGDLPPKARRLVRLFEVVSYLQTKHSEIPASAYRNLIENGRVVIDPDDAEDGSVSLRNLILEDPEFKAWPVCVESIVKDFIKDRLTEMSEPRETDRAVRHA